MLAGGDPRDAATASPEPARSEAPGGRASKGGSPAESELADRFWERVRVFAARRLGPAEAEDVAQETLRRVVEAIRDDRIREPDALPGFVFQTARHVCLQRHRSDSRRSRAFERLETTGSGPRERPDPLAALVSERRRTEVHRALERLREADRELLRMTFFDDVDTAEIARRLEITAGAVRVRRHRALRRLRELLQGAVG